MNEKPPVGEPVILWNRGPKYRTPEVPCNDTRRDVDWYKRPSARHNQAPRGRPWLEWLRGLFR